MNTGVRGAPSGLFVGLATLDVVQLVDGMPGPNQKVTAAESWLAAGGPAAAAAIAFSALGGSATLVTALGTNSAAALVRADLVAAGVTVIDRAPDGFGLAPAVVIVDAATGERTVVGGPVHPPQTLPVEESVLDGCDVVLVDGHHPALARAVVPAAADRAVPVVVDAGSHKPVFDELWGHTSDVICSADYSHPSGRSHETLLEHGPSLVAVSHGSDPLQWWSSDESGEVPVPRVAVADTLGAGDVLHGAYAYALAVGSPRADALAFGVAAASRRVACLGPFSWRDDLKRWRRVP
ncbi:PfkB family carbohydrate kinase [Tessaracoccus caeni]|uniref:PfkB family carbohydrate kinase n=1 Tax=Tessaracoccus caeni TaxID=3031239 RepID=UPI0023DB3359|nr:PfkB family carbohydrate kinase [Tessaracoccus caeni]MDF1488547.1 PfkB family carbohydrate kinase [Tessaracoccus caeni]